MPDMGTKKKVTMVGGEESPPTPAGRTAAPASPGRGQAGKLRFFAFISWFAAIVLEVFAILQLRKAPVNTVLLIVLIAADLVFAVVGSLLWKRANRFSPASEKEPIRFFIQNQLGVLMAMIAFLPLVILIFTNKNMKGKQKGLVGAVAIIALVIAGYFGIDFNPPSQEKVAAQSQEAAAQASEVESLIGANMVFWTKSGTKYHLYSDCYHINTDKTQEIFQGTVAKAKELKNITELCSTCRGRAEKEKALKTETPAGAVEEKKNN